MALSLCEYSHVILSPRLSLVKWIRSDGDQGMDCQTRGLACMDRSASWTRERGKRLGHTWCPELSPCSRRRLCKDCLLMVIRRGRKRILLETQNQFLLGFTQSGVVKSQARVLFPAFFKRRKPCASGGLSSLLVRLINAIFPLLPSLSPGLLRFLPLFHKQNKNQIKRLNVCREITFREQTQNGGGFGEHELDQLKGSPPPYIKPHFRM